MCTCVHVRMWFVVDIVFGDPFLFRPSFLAPSDATSPKVDSGRDDWWKWSDYFVTDSFYSLNHGDTIVIFGFDYCGLTIFIFLAVFFPFPYFDLFLVFISWLFLTMCLMQHL